MNDPDTNVEQIAALMDTAERIEVAPADYSEGGDNPNSPVGLYEDPALKVALVEGAPE